ncbi:MAG TPA: NAD-dependent epimerase/dehydratase family protein [Saprospiraceae bacterium]|nr:NAD-dependent epimerase/dehydratase family protein [Saprospiraceae bacterium]HMP25142.1 NAD-dependent epimerase/dehydratase family protein [Saprospiraceae bacterium]
MYKNRILVTGATGLLGSNVVAMLNRRGYRVRVLLRSSSSTIALQGLEYESHYGDITDAASVCAAAQGCVAIIHAAANTTQWGANMQAHDAVNVVGTRNVITACKQASVERLIHVSTANTFPPGSLQQPGDESGVFAHGPAPSRYIETKRQAEALVLEAVQTEGLPAIIVNPTFIIGARDAQPSSGKMILHYLRAPVVLCPPGGKNFVPVEDAATAIVNALQSGHYGERYLLASENLSYRDFFRLVGEATERRRRIVPLSPWLLKSAGRLGDLAQQFARDPLPLNFTNATLLTIDNYYTAAKAITELDMPQTDLSDAIQTAFRWFVQYDYL